MALIAPSAVAVRTTGTMPMSVMKDKICCLVIFRERLPIHYRAVLGIITFLVPPVMFDFIRHGVFVELDTEARAGGQIEIALANGEGFFQIALTERDLLLAQEIRNGRRDLDA